VIIFLKKLAILTKIQPKKNIENRFMLSKQFQSYNFLFLQSSVKKANQFIARQYMIGYIISYCDDHLLHETYSTITIIKIEEDSST
jgi:hypothetical protein